MASLSESRMGRSVYFCRIKSCAQSLGTVDSISRTTFSGENVSSILRLQIRDHFGKKRKLLLKIIPRKGILVPEALPRICSDIQRLKLRPQDAFETPLLGGSYAFSSGKKCDYEVVEDFEFPDARHHYFCNSHCSQTEKLQATQLIAASLAHLHFGNPELVDSQKEGEFHAYRHGDFNYRNVLVDLDSSRVFFVDGLGLYKASVGGDIRTFLYVLWHQFVESSKKVSAEQFSQISHLTNVFIESYGREANALIDREKFPAFDGESFAKFYAAAALEMLRYRLEKSPAHFEIRKNTDRRDYFLTHYREVLISWDFTPDEMQRLAKTSAR